MVHESISTRFFNRDLHAIDATSARQRGELLRRHRLRVHAAHTTGTGGVHRGETCDGNDDGPARPTPAGPTTSSRPASARARTRRPHDERAPRTDFGAPVSLIDLRTGPVGRGALLLRLPDCHRESTRRSTRSSLIRTYVIRTKGRVLRRDRDDALQEEGVRRRGLCLQRDKSYRRQGGVCADDDLLHVAVSHQKQ